MKNVKVLLVANGENQGTYGIEAIYNEKLHGHLLSEKVHKFISWDFNQTVEVDKYQVITLKLPVWFEDYMIVSSNWLIAMKWLAGFGFKPEWGLKWFDKFRDMGTKNAYYLIKLINSTPRTEFKKSLKEQVINWLNEDSPKFNSPLSGRQMEALYNKWANMDYKSLDNGLYRSNYYTIAYN